MSTHKVCFHGEIRKNQHFLVEKWALSGAMVTGFEMGIIITISNN